MVEEIAHRFEKSSVHLVVGTGKATAHSSRLDTKIHWGSNGGENTLLCQKAKHMVRRVGVIESMANVKPAAVQLKVYLCSWRITPVFDIVTGVDKVDSLSIDGGYVKETEALLTFLYLIPATVGLGEVVLQLLIDGLVEDLDTISLSRSGQRG